MFSDRHYVPILKGKRAEFPAIGNLKSRDSITPLFEAASADKPAFIPEQLANQNWISPYFVDFVFFDDEGAQESEWKQHPIWKCFESIHEKKQRGIPVTGISRSPAYQESVRRIVASNDTGLAIRLVPDDFGDDGEGGNLERYIKAILQLAGVGPHQVDIIVDLGSVEGMSAAAVSLGHRSNLELLPMVLEWRSLTVASGSFPQGLAPLARNAWNTVSRNDWLGWLRTRQSKPSRLPSFADYAIAHPNLPPTGQATTLAQIRYSTPDQFLIWKGENAITKGFDQFFGICVDLITRSEYRGQHFSWGDLEIHTKATTQDSPGNAETWRRIGTNHHIETVLEQIANL